MMDKRRIYVILIAIVSLTVVFVSVSYAWFYQQAGLATLLDIVPPDSIKIVPVNEQGGDVTMLDLDYNEIYGDKKDLDTKRVTIYRPLYVSSTSPVHQLEIVHTTNLEGLTFDVYWTNSNSYVNIDDLLESQNKLSGSYKNQQSANSTLAESDRLNNYKDGDSVEEHVYPLYWLADTTGDKSYVADSDISKVAIPVTSLKGTKYDPAKQTNRNYYKTQYYLVISWIETGKETDLFYILAQNVAVTEKSEGSVVTP